LGGARRCSRASRQRSSGATGHNGFTPSADEAKTATILFGKMIGRLLCLMAWAIPAFGLTWRLSKIGEREYFLDKTA
jgi:hypothetical protein